MLIFSTSRLFQLFLFPTFLFLSRGTPAPSQGGRPTPATGDQPCSSSEMYTTNKHDQEEAAKLKARLANQQGAAKKSSEDRVPNVSIDEGAHKYVLLRAKESGAAAAEHFVVSQRGAHYHRNAAEPMVNVLQHTGYEQIEILGGGRLTLNSKEKKISIFGFSYSFGQPDHGISRKTILEDPRYKDFDVTTSNEGY